MLDMTYDPRAAGEIIRYHTWRVAHRQSVGEHTWQILRILLTVWPACPRRVLIHATIHDVGEMAGDISYPFKLMFAELKAGSDKAENYVKHEMRKCVGLPQSHPLSPYEYAIFKACEFVEMWEYGLCEMNRGNDYGDIIVDRMNREIGPALHRLETDLASTQDARQHPGIPAAIHRYVLARLKQEKTV